MNNTVGHFVALLCAFVAVVLLGPLLWLATLFFSTMMGPTSSWGWVAALTVAALPVLLIASLIGAVRSYRCPNVLRLLSATLPLIAVVLFFWANDIGTWH